MDIDASLNVTGPSATAGRETKQLDLDLSISSEGETTIRVFGRTTGKFDTKLILTFDEFEWERLKKAIAATDALLAELKRRGVTFKLGDG